MNQEQIRAEIARLEGTIDRLRGEAHAIANETTLYPGRDQLRDNYYREESRRSGSIAIRQSIAGAEQQLAFYRGLLR